MTGRDIRDILFLELVIVFLERNGPANANLILFKLQAVRQVNCCSKRFDLSANILHLESACCH